MLEYYFWRAKPLITWIISIVAILSLVAITILVLLPSGSPSVVVFEPTENNLTIYEREYTLDDGYSYVYTDGRYLYDNEKERLPKLALSSYSLLSIDLSTSVYNEFETFSVSSLINPMLLGTFDNVVPYNYEGTQQDITRYIALLFGQGFIPVYLSETAGVTELHVSKGEELVRIFVQSNNMKLYSPLLTLEEVSVIGR